MVAPVVEQNRCSFLVLMRVECVKRLESADGGGGGGSCVDLVVENGSKLVWEIVTSWPYTSSTELKSQTLVVCDQRRRW